MLSQHSGLESFHLFLPYSPFKFSRTQPPAAPETRWSADETTLKMHLLELGSSACCYMRPLPPWLPPKLVCCSWSCLSREELLAKTVSALLGDQGNMGWHLPTHKPSVLYHALFHKPPWQFCQKSSTHGMSAEYCLSPLMILSLPCLQRLPLILGLLLV